MADTKLPEFVNWKNVFIFIVFLLIIQALAKIFTSGTFKNISSFFDSITGAGAAGAETVKDCFGNNGVNLINPAECPLGFAGILGFLTMSFGKFVIALRGSGNESIEQRKFLTGEDQLSIIDDAYRKTYTNKTDDSLNEEFKKLNNRDPTDAEKKYLRFSSAMDEVKKSNIESVEKSPINPEQIASETERAKQNYNVDREKYAKRLGLTPDQIESTHKIYRPIDVDVSKIRSRG